MTQWTDKHYDFNYTLTDKDIEAGSIKLDPYFVAKQWKTGSKDDSGALFHVLKTVARFGDKNPVEREVKALYAQVKRLAELNGVPLEVIEQVHVPNNDLWYPDSSGEWIEYDGSGQPVDNGVVVEVLLHSERDEHYQNRMPLRASEWDWDIEVGSAKIVAYKIVK